MSFPVTGARTVHDEALGSYAFPTAIEPCSSDVAGDLSATLRWAESNASELEHALTTSGALLLRGFPLQNPEHFDAFTAALGYPELAYDGADGNAHLELAQRSPHRVLFHCADARAAGAATPLLDAHRVYSKLKTFAPAFVDELEAKGVRYTRVMTLDDRAHSPIGRGWRKTFGVNGPTQLEKKLAAEKNGDVVEWLDASRFEAQGVDASMYPLRHYGPVMDAVLLDEPDPRTPRKSASASLTRFSPRHPRLDGRPEQTRAERGVRRRRRDALGGHGDDGARLRGGERRRALVRRRRAAHQQPAGDALAAERRRRGIRQRRRAEARSG